MVMSVICQYAVNLKFSPSNWKILPKYFIYTSKPNTFLQSQAQQLVLTLQKNQKYILSKLYDLLFFKANTLILTDCTNRNSTKFQLV